MPMTSLCLLTQCKKQNFYFIKWKVLPNLLDYFSTQIKQSTCVSTRLLMIAFTQQSQIEKVEDFKYLGSYTKQKNMTPSAEKPRHGQQFMPLTKFGERHLKIFRKIVEPIMIYGCDSWSLTQSVENALDSTYTRMLQKIKNVSWHHHTTNQELYGSLPQITTIVRQWRLRLAGHVMRHDEAANKVLLWKPNGPLRRGRPTITLQNILEKDTNLSRTNLIATIKNQNHWKETMSPH